MSNQDANPDQTTGLEAGGGVAPGDLSPQASQTSASAGHQPDVPDAGNRIGIVAVLVGAALLAVLFLVWAVTRGMSL